MVAVSSPGHTHTLSLSLDGTDDHRRCSELEDLRHGKVGNSVESQIEGFDVGNVLVGRLGDEMRSEGSRQTGDTELEVVLKDLIGRPSVLSGFGIMNVLSIAHYLALSAVEGPSENNFVLAPAAVGSLLPTGNGRGVADSKLESDLLFGKAKSFGSVFDAVVNLVGAENVRHDGCLNFARLIGNRCRWLFFGSSCSKDLEKKLNLSVFGWVDIGAINRMLTRLSAATINSLQVLSDGGREAKIVVVERQNDHQADGETWVDRTLSRNRRPGFWMR